MNLLPITGDFVRALGWTILHSMWQAFFIYTCLRIVLKLWPLAGARIKYNLSLLSLSGIFTWFLATLCMHMQRLQEARTITLQTSSIISLQDTIPLTAVYPNQEPLMWLFPNLELCFPILVTLYITGMTGMTIKLLTDLFQLNQIRTTRIEPMGAAWDKHLDKLATRLQIPRKVKLLISRHVQVPVMLGFLKPLILLPVAMVNNLTEEQLEAILLHELAHIKRNDYLLNIFQSIVETILFFNPFVWLISRIIRMEREHCCDDLVIASTVQPLQYAHALVALEEYRLTANRLTMAAADSKQHLFHRIKRIMEMKTKHLNYSQQFLAVLIIVTSLVSIAWLNPAKGKGNETAQTKIKEKQETAVAPKKAAAVADYQEVAPSSPQTTNSNFQHQLAAASGDTTEPAAPTRLPDEIPASVPTPSPAPAPLSPLQADLSADQADNIILSDQNNTVSNSKINTTYSQVIADSKTGKRTVTNKSSDTFNYNYRFDYQVNKDEIKKQIREAQESIQLAMKQMKQVDMKKVQADMQAATQNVDWNNISADIRKAQAESVAALQNVNWDQITKAQQEAAEALKNINFDAINKNLQIAYNNNFNSKELNENIRKELAAGRQATDAAGIEAAFASKSAARKFRAEALANAAKAREAAGKTREEVYDKMSAEIAKAKKEADKARVSNTQYREMINQMGADKLLDTKKDYKVEKNSTGLYINGVKQPDSVTGKYSNYLTSKHVTIKGTSGSFMVNIEN